MSFKLSLLVALLIPFVIPISTALFAQCMCAAVLLLSRHLQISVPAFAALHSLNYLNCAFVLSVAM